jgi:AraC family transcriptional regulator, regulatory protein of adaptative response / methylated-DNA-[protein]-cysteine methyltransferase
MANKTSQQQSGYQTIASAIEFVAKHRQQQPRLGDIAQHLKLSEPYLQRLFSDWAGVSPKQYLQYLTKEHAKQQLQSESVLDAALTSGLSGSGRLHDLMVNWEAMTPGEYKQHGKGLTIQYASCSSPFGQCFVASTNRGICQLAFYDQENERKALEVQLHLDWYQANIRHAPETIGQYAAQIFGKATGNASLKLLLKGSKFQLKVWEALLAIPEGKILCYQQVAVMIGAPASVRAVASAIAKNQIGYLIPCHRVIRANGEFSNYRWGKTRKQAMLGWEASRSDPD